MLWENRILLTIFSFFMPRSSKPRTGENNIENEDIVLDGEATGDDLHVIGFDERQTGDEVDGVLESASLTGLASSLSQKVSSNGEKRDDEEIVRDLEKRRIGFKDAVKLLVLLHAPELSDEDMDEMVKIAGFAVTDEALIQYIESLKSQKNILTTEQAELMKSVRRTRAQTAEWASQHESIEAQVSAETIGSD